MSSMDSSVHENNSNFFLTSIGKKKPSYTFSKENSNQGYILNVDNSENKKKITTDWVKL